MTNPFQTQWINARAVSSKKQALVSQKPNIVWAFLKDLLIIVVVGGVFTVLVFVLKIGQRIMGVLSN